MDTVMTDRGYSSLRRVLAGRGIVHEKTIPPPKPPRPKGSRRSRAAVPPGAATAAARKKHFTTLGPLVRVEHAIGELRRCRRATRSYEGTVASAKGWTDVACVGYLLTRLPM